MKTSRYLFIGLLFVAALVWGCKKEKPQPEFNTGLALSDNYNNLPIAPNGFSGTLPDAYVIPDMPPAGNQGQTNSCVGWATAYAMASYYRHERYSLSTYDDQTKCSPSYVYNQIHGSNCSGSFIDEALDLLKVQGVSTLSEMPFTNQCELQPTAVQIAAAAVNKIASYGVVQNDPDLIKGHLVANHPVIIGVELDNGFCACMNGADTWEGTSGDCDIAGSHHAMAVYGYDNNKQAFLVLNSWGTGFGDNGSVWIPYTKFASVTKERYVAFPVATSNCAAIQLSAVTDMNFGSVVANPAPAPSRQLRIRNTGTCDLVVTDIQCPNGYTDDMTGNTTIPAGSYNDFTIRFQPTVSGTYNGILTVISNATSGTSTASLTGTCSGQSGSNGSLGVATSSIDFGTVSMGSNQTRTFVISNVGTGTLSVTSVTNSNSSAFTLSGASTPFSLGQSQSQTVTVTLNTQTVGAVTGQISISSSGGSATISLSGVVGSGGGSCTGTFTDPRDGKTYPVITIGGQCWMNANLNYDDPNSFLDRCFDSNSSNCQTYGRMYAPASLASIAPPGWHVPSSAEWQTLLDNFLSTSLYNDLMNAGWTMQLGGTYHSGSFYDFPVVADYWSSTVGSTNYNCIVNIPNHDGITIDSWWPEVRNNHLCDSWLCYVRLVKD